MLLQVLVGTSVMEKIITLLQSKCFFWRWTKNKITLVIQTQTFCVHFCSVTVTSDLSVTHLVTARCFQQLHCGWLIWVPNVWQRPDCLSLRKFLLGSRGRGCWADWRAPLVCHFLFKPPPPPDLTIDQHIFTQFENCSMAQAVLLYSIS